MLEWSLLSRLTQRDHGTPKLWQKKKEFSEAGISLNSHGCSKRGTVDNSTWKASCQSGTENGEGANMMQRNFETEILSYRIFLSSMHLPCKSFMPGRIYTLLVTLLCHQDAHWTLNPSIHTISQILVCELRYHQYIRKYALNSLNNSMNKIVFAAECKQK